MLRRALACWFVGLSFALTMQPAKAGPALLFEPETGEVLHAYEPHQRWHPASLAKLMTLYVVFDAVERGEVEPDTPVRISPRAAVETVNTMDWPAGTEIELGGAVTILAVKSANDVAVAVAESLSGDVDSFVSRMNEAAQELGMGDTRFTNPHGLHDPQQYTSARDLALLVTTLLTRFPEQRPLYAMQRAEVRGEELTSFNRLLGRFPGADGLKTGYVCASGWNIAASATREGRRLVAIVLGGLREGHREEIAAELLEAGFSGELDAGSRTVEDLPRPASTEEPVNMRPYACEGRPPPARIASFGLDDAPLPRARPSD